MCVREREREREGQTDRHTDRKRDRQTDKTQPAQRDAKWICYLFMTKKR